MTLPAVAFLFAGRARRLLAVGFLLLLPVAIACGLSMREYAERVSVLAARQRAGGPSAFSTRDLAGIWGLNVAMAAGGLICGLPEVALETLLLAVPAGGHRRFDSEFAMRSPRVRAAVGEMLAKARGCACETLSLPPREIAWESYDAKTDSPRVALALNPFMLSGEAERGSDGVWRLYLRGRIAIRYPEKGRVRLTDDVVIEEGLFWVLQKRGWLFPYEAEWRWTVRGDDLRLADDSPRTSFVERVIF